MRRSGLERAFDDAVGPPSPDCPVCGRPGRGTNIVRIPSADYEFAKCAECGGSVTNKGVPVGIPGPDGVVYLKRYILPDWEHD